MSSQRSNASHDPDSTVTDPDSNVTESPEAAAAIEQAVGQADDLKVRLGVTTAFAVVLIPAGKLTEPKLLSTTEKDPVYDAF